MRYKTTLVSILTFIVFAFPGCKFGKELKETYQIKELDQNNALKVFVKKYVKEPLFIRAYSIDDKQYILAAFNDYDKFRFIVLSAFANSWDEESVFTLDEYFEIPEYYEPFESAYGISDTVSNFQITLHNNQPTFFYYLTTGVGNSGLYEYVFIDYDIIAKKNYLIRVFNSEPNLVDLKFDFSKGINYPPAIKKDLETKISSVFRDLTNQETNQENKSPFDEWTLKNGSIYKNLNESNKYFPVLFVSVTEQTFKEDLSQSERLFSNDEFEVYSRFKGPVYMIDKMNKSYKIIWYPESVYDWIQSCEYTNNHIYLFTQNNFYYALNLITRKIRKINGEK